ncbi:MAG TPA: GFA family protein [Terrimicrobium sp.]
MQIHFTGGCVCGTIRYECTAEPILMFNCHCRDCQRVSGGAFTPVVYVPAHAFRLTGGSLRYYATPSEAGGYNIRGFCPDCGSRISGGEGPNGIGVTASSLDDPSWFRAELDMWVSDAQPWDHLDLKRPMFSQYPP